MTPKTSPDAFTRGLTEGRPATDDPTAARPPVPEYPRVAEMLQRIRSVSPPHPVGAPEPPRAPAPATAPSGVPEGAVPMPDDMLLGSPLTHGATRVSTPAAAAAAAPAPVAPMAAAPAPVAPMAAAPAAPVAAPAQPLAAPAQPLAAPAQPAAWPGEVVAVYAPGSVVPVEDPARYAADDEDLFLSDEETEALIADMTLRDTAREALRARLLAFGDQRHTRSAYEIVFLMLAFAVMVLITAPPLVQVLLALRGTAPG